MTIKNRAETKIKKLKEIIEKLEIENQKLKDELAKKDQELNEFKK